MMREIPVEDIRNKLSYDPLAGFFHWKIRARGIRFGAVAGSKAATGYLTIRINDELMLAHRIAWAHVHGSWPTQQIDHINGDRSDNRILNLREATASQNGANQKARPNKCGFKGVVKNREKWAAKIVRNGKRYHLGSFETPLLAHRAYMQAAIKLHGEFARAA